MHLPLFWQDQKRSSLSCKNLLPVINNHYDGIDCAVRLSSNDHLEMESLISQNLVLKTTCFNVASGTFALPVPDATFPSTDSFCGMSDVP